MIPLICGLVAIVSWLAFLFFGRRLLNSIGQEGREQGLHFELQAAPRSDHHVESMLAHNPRSPILLRQYVANAIDRNDLVEALRRSEMFVTRAPRAPEAWVAHADVLRRSGRAEESVAVLRKAMRRLPRRVEILAAWAHEALERQDWAEVVRRFVPVRRRAPRRIDGYAEPAKALAHVGRPDEAEQLIAEGLVQLADVADMWHQAAHIADIVGKLDEAIGRWEAMRERFPGEPGGYSFGAEGLARAGRAAEAEELIRQARDFFPGDKHVAEVAARLIPPEVQEPAPAEPPAP